MGGGVSGGIGHFCNNRSRFSGMSIQFRTGLRPDQFQAGTKKTSASSKLPAKQRLRYFPKSTKASVYTEALEPTGSSQSNNYCSVTLCAIMAAANRAS